MGEENYGNVERRREQRSRHFAVLTYRMYAPRVKKAAVLLDELFRTFPPVPDVYLTLSLSVPLE